jgi:hypothetical protein
MKKFLIILMSFCISKLLFSQESLTYYDLIDRLYDMEYLANPPEVGEQSGNFSSFERGVVNGELTKWGSRYVEETDSYFNWEANIDGTGYIRNEGDDILIFEKDGPGVIWRVWSAWPGDGNIKIYLDGSTEPIIRKPFKDFFTTFDDSEMNVVVDMNLPNLSMKLSRGSNRFIPLPYNKHCKIVMEKNWGNYYHITYSTYPSTTKLPVFNGTFEKGIGIYLAEADRELANRGYWRKKYDKEIISLKETKVSGGSSKTVETITGNCAITHFKIRFDDTQLTPTQVKEMLAKTWIRITWDNDKKPSVMAPLGMFFGSYPEYQPYRTIPMGVLPGQLYSNWFMPFSEKAKIEMINRGENSCRLTWEIVHSPLDQPAGQLLRFHAKWQDGLYREEVSSKGREEDWPILLTKGTGRYCGVTLGVDNRWKEPRQEAKSWWYDAWDNKTIDWWWGEGDEKFYVDGEKFPSTFGTGSEDYIGYAWSAEPPFALFDSPFAAQPQTPVSGNGFTLVNRFQIADNIPFHTSFTGVIEKYKPDFWGDDKSNTCLFQSVAFWYQMPGEEDRY